MIKFLICDLECSDLMPSAAEILQAAFIEVDENYTELDRRLYKIRPRVWNSYSDQAAKIHGITRQEAFTYPPYAEAMRDMLTYIASFKSVHFVMHVNPIGDRYYDASAIRYHALDNNLYFEVQQAIPGSKYISTHSLAKRLSLPCKLDLASLHKYYFPLSSHTHHDAMSDCEATFEIFKYIDGYKLWREYDAIRFDSPDSGDERTQNSNSRGTKRASRRVTQKRATSVVPV